MHAVICRDAVRLPCATPSCFRNSYLTTPLPCSVSFPFCFCPTARSRVLPLYLSLVGTGSSCTLTKWRHWRACVCHYCYPSLRVIFDSSLAQTRVLKPKLAHFCLLSSCCLSWHRHSHSFCSRSHACPWPPLLPLSFPLPLVVVSPSAYELTLSVHATHHRLSQL